MFLFPHALNLVTGTASSRERSRWTCGGTSPTPPARPRCPRMSSSSKSKPRISVPQSSNITIKWQVMLWSMSCLRFESSQMGFFFFPLKSIFGRSGFPHDQINVCWHILVISCWTYLRVFTISGPSAGSWRAACCWPGPWSTWRSGGGSSPSGRLY